MVFFVVVPLLFGFFGNFLLPLHIGSKDVAYPRINSIGFWVLPAGFLLICKAAFLRHQMWKPKEVTDTTYSTIIGSNNHSIEGILMSRGSSTAPASYTECAANMFRSLRWDLRNFIENIWCYLARPDTEEFIRRKVFLEKSLDSHTTCTGWTFITPFTSNVGRSATGPVDCLILSVIFAGITSTISLTNLLVTRRTLSMPGLLNRRFLLPFFTVAMLLSLRFLALITPVLAGCMIMIFTDRH
jgi:heme/copper-type cytochrome/quinol oxidase subunit 1